MKRKLLSVFLSLCMMLTLVPGALAAEPEPTPSEEGEITTQAALKNALTAAGSANNAGDKVVTLNGDIVLDNTGVAANSAAITVPEGVTLNGNGHTISVGKQWNGETKTHILSVENTQAETTTTIKNLTIVGSADTKSGIHAYNCTGTVKLEDVTIQNCGNAAVQVNSSKVEATDLNTEGNVWGAVNVDKGASLDTSPSFTLTSGTLKEPTKIWTELANSSDNDDNSSKIISVPETWKEMKSDFDGKTYYANADDVAIWVGETAYATLQDAAKAVGENSSNVKTITLKGDITVTNQPKEGTLGVNEAAVTLPAGTSLDGQDHTITAIADWATGDNSKPKNHILGVNTPTSDVTIQNVTIVGNESTKHGINAYANSTNTRTSSGKLTVENVTIRNCGTAGMVVQGMEVNATNLTTSGNAWGAVNVDDAEGSKLSLSKADLAEDIQVWTEMTSVSVGDITIDGTDFTQVKGEGSSDDETGLKGFTYYTTDPSKLGEASITKDDVTTVYTTFENALTAAQTGDSEGTSSATEIELLKNVEVENLISITSAGLTINGNDKIIKCVQSGETANGTMITVQQNVNNVTIKNLTVDTNGKTKHGIQFYCAEGGKLKGVTVNGGTFTSVMVNGAKATLTDCTLNPADGAYANIEYGMGTGVTTQPEIILSNVTGNAEKPLVYADKTTADKFKAEGSENESYADIAKKINEKLTGADVTIIVTGGDGKVDEENSVVGTQLYTITLDANGGTVETSTLTTNNEGKLSDLPNPNHSNNKYTFQYWTLNGTKVTEDTVFTGDATIVAQWSYSGGGGGGGGSVTTKYTLSFDTNGGSAIAKVTKEKGTTVDLGQYVPTREGYTFAGWYSDEALTQKVTSVKLNGNTTVYAKWTENAVTPILPFTDVKSGDWFYEAVQYVYDKGMMTGVSADRFAPASTTTRGMIVTILYRLENEPAVSGGSAFTDVESGAWYADAVAWAAANDIVNGTSATTFAPNSPITREQMAAILYRYAAYKGYDVSQKADLSGYTDATSISGYAKDALAWANAQKLITGVTDTTLNPQGSATRAQVATILMRLCETVVK
ncbi:S-layer homology domain-containing protein [Evtepia gabavorous]|uniref:S-layer homology domain-containing protein n=2 Tax=Evtepia gabavorous TaxID=2211183 RepID=UPI003AF1295F